MQIDTKLSGIIQAARTTAENATLKPLDRNADLREAAEQFEAIFLNEFIKQARKAKLADDILGSDAQDTYQEMMDRELSTQLAGRVNLGIAEALVRQLGGTSEG
ncbi:MAG: rod-binding protein [Candidatus Puniceispirillaceae bacterium]|jgi:flagellar protein FlgJ|tara:strand:- start:638 stop:949 length:312 start_codon:yes stop_codon:yes gene_type:complete